VRASVFYAILVLILQALFWNVDDTTASRFLPIVFAVVGLGAYWYAAHLWNREVVLYEQGFTYMQGSRMGQFRYTEIVRVEPDVQHLTLFGRFQRTGYHYKLITDADEILHITNLYSDIAKLVNRLEAFVTRDRLPLLQAALDAGNMVDVGAGLLLSKNGLEYNGRELFWHELTRQRIKAGQLIFATREDENWASIPVKELNNPVLLLAVLKQHTTTTSAPAQE
jgi:hypothetical protein